MRVHDCVQGSPEWLQLRCGMPTASNFSKIVTPGGKLSKSAEPYLWELVAERIMGRQADGFHGEWMDRGNRLEDEAAAYYALQRDVDPIIVGFITDDAQTYGASPDRLVGEDGQLEIKSPSAGVHCRFLYEGKELDEKHKPQLQGNLLVSGRAWIDILSYHPGLPDVIVRAERDEQYIDTLRKALDAFTVLLANRYEAVRAEVPEPEVREETPVEAMRAAMIAGQEVSR